MKLLKAALRPAVRKGREFIRNSVGRVDHASHHQQLQRSIINQYMVQRRQGITLYPNIKDAGFRVYSEFEEDGIILYVLSMIGPRTKRVVEIGCGNGSECMATNLILNHGFDGYLFDGSESNIRHACEFFSSQ